MKGDNSVLEAEEGEEEEPLDKGTKNREKGMLKMLIMHIRRMLKNKIVRRTRVRRTEKMLIISIPRTQV